MCDEQTDEQCDCYMPPYRGHKNMQASTYSRLTHLRGFHDDWAKNVTSIHVIQLTGTIFELNSHIKQTNLARFYQKFFDPAWPIFELRLDIIYIQLLTKFGEDWMKTTFWPTDGQTDRPTDTNIMPKNQSEPSITGHIDSNNDAVQGGMQATE
ncbi:hypothetical protein DPMN_039906 [Dreissena polymorpha]|uniref:Uncharacterized protein n=1 Tax=Dreissena polymorpha TaxID=45954 RepID=A0A9D4HUT4_DREPO|nr:hypothetical protein DPMN_039906 [Dreissena polymorpha]